MLRGVRNWKSFYHPPYCYAMPEIQFHNVALAYDQRIVLQPFDLTLTEQRIGIIGANGNGKSSLVRLINGLHEPTQGQVFYNGMDVAEEGKAVRKKIGFVFSDADNQIVMPTVIEDLAFSLRRSKLPKPERQARVQSMLHRFNLQDHANHSPHLLSGGQKQLLALASVLILEPETIIADEPTTLLDVRNRLKLQRIFRDLEQQLIVVSHDLDFIADFDRILCIHDGEIYADGKPEEVIPAYLSLMEAEDA